MRSPTSGSGDGAEGGGASPAARKGQSATSRSGLFLRPPFPRRPEMKPIHRVIALAKSSRAQDGGAEPEVAGPYLSAAGPGYAIPNRSEERRVGNECVSTCRSRWEP